MSILVNRNTRVICQGFTGKQGTFHSQAALAYWDAWANVQVPFGPRDSARVPDHWRTFGQRHSPLTGSPRLAINASNAILNYLYTLLVPSDANAL